MNKKLFSMAIGCILSSFAYGQSFDDFFTDKTIRADYLFTGDKNKQDIVLDGLISTSGWAGRRHHLSDLPLEGNGQITMTDKESGKIIYRTSFSSLFQEWIGETEAKELKKGFENSFLMPFPKHNAIVKVSLYNANREISASFEHEIKPDDILIRNNDSKDTVPYKYLLKNGSAMDCIDVVIMAEGYTKKEMGTFYKDAQKACDAIFSHKPFSENKRYFNIIAAGTESRDSGVSIPRENNWKETAVSSHFDTFYSDRYLTTSNVKDIHDLLSGIPYEHIIILANTDTYGGGGIYNAFTLTTAHHSMFEPVVVHEFGHSFAGLADEYAYTDEPSPLYPYSIEPWEQNITTMANFESKWKDMVNPDTDIPTKGTDKNKIGAYEGAGYTKKGIFRPTYDCRMRTNEAPAFCPVCQRAIQRLIDFYTK